MTDDAGIRHDPRTRFRSTIRPEAWELVRQRLFGAKADREIRTEEQELSLNTELTRQIHNSQRHCMSMFSANRQPVIRRSDDQTEARSGRAQTCFDVTR
jgi:hypothetical protein